ncbi:hypothetical protein B2G71_08305 [Novosphingobium sp. PC22D]|uniref:hypothetical protein n=1 Tax=Novosphingobium sp. PC22D TaxID=1962403 RepID=UPI000BEF9064|nr:hypothetical protein [Novosphingobium sp. PC22D]PEQ13417.1 hypothetical protein B2G71_08305 [Novosphingobium sp. PC22D]
MHQITHVSQGIETAIRKLGEGLAECNAAISELSQSFGGLAERLGDEALEQGFVELGLMSAASRALIDRQVYESRILARLVAIEKSACAPLQNLRNDIRMTEMLVTNARVVAAGIIDAEEDMSVFSEDLTELSRHMKTGIESLGSTAKFLSVQLSAAVDGQTAFLRGEGGNLEANLAKLERHLSSLDLARNVASQAAAKVGTGLAELRKSISELIPLMQIGDATRQRLEHVQMARELASQGADSGDPISNFAEALLQDASDAFEQDVKLARQRLGAITDEVARLLVQIGDHGRALNESSIAAIHSAIHATIALLSQCGQSHERSRTLRNEVRDAVAQVERRLEELSEFGFKAHIVSLNATVRCARLGSGGAALNVVAEQLRGMFADMDRSANAVLEAYGDAGKVVLEMEEGGHSEAESDFADQSHRCSNALEPFKEAGLLADHVQAHLAARSKHVEACMESMSHAIASLESLRDEFRSKPIVDTGRKLQSALSDAGRSDLIAFRGKLTMQSERALFDAHFPDLDTPDGALAA